jgi:hypothetical protein
MDTLAAALVMMLPLPSLPVIPAAPCLPRKVFSGVEVWVQTRECLVYSYNPIESKLTSTLPFNARLANVPMFLLPRLTITTVHLKNSS